MINEVQLKQEGQRRMTFTCWALLDVAITENNFRYSFIKKIFKIVIGVLKEFLLLNLKIEKKIFNLKQNSKA